MTNIDRKWFQDYLDYHMHKSKLQEKLYERDFSYLDSEIERNPDFRKLMNTSLTELDDNWHFSFSGDDWNFFKETDNNTYYDFIRYLMGRFSQYKTFISENSKGKPLGWIVYEKDGAIVYNIKFGSFSNNTKDNLELLQDVRKEFNNLLDECLLMEWMADKNNTKIFKIYNDLVTKYHGIIKSEGSSTYQFLVSKKINLKDYKNLYD